MKAVLLCVLSILTLSQSDVCTAVYGNCNNVQSLTGLQGCINSASSCTPSSATPFCATCALITQTSGPDFNLGNPMVAQCIYEFARTCQKNLDVGADSFVCSGSSSGTTSPCADAFVTYASIDDLVASSDYPLCVSVANANCLGYTSHPWCSVGGTSLAGSNVVSFLDNLQSSCNFPLRAKRGTFVFQAGTVSGDTVNGLLLGDLESLTGTTPSQNLFASANYSVSANVITAEVDIISGVQNKSPDSVADYLSALFNDPTSNIHKGNVTKYLSGLSFADNYPFAANSQGANLSDSQKAGIVAGVLIFLVLVLVVYQLYAYHSKRTGEESDSDEDDEDSRIIHQRNQARYAEANKQEAAPSAAPSQPQVHVQSQDEAITSWS